MGTVVCVIANTMQAESAAEAKHGEEAPEQKEEQPNDHEDENLEKEVKNEVRIAHTF